MILILIKINTHLSPKMTAIKLVYKEVIMRGRIVTDEQEKIIRLLYGCVKTMRDEQIFIKVESLITFSERL